jgi:hypothetical protein
MIDKNEAIIIGAPHPLLGMVYRNFVDESDVNYPDHYGYTCDAEYATHLRMDWRSYDFLVWKMDTMFLDSAMSRAACKEYPTNPLNHEAWETLQEAGQGLPEFWAWLRTAQWQDITVAISEDTEVI